MQTHAAENRLKQKHTSLLHIGYWIVQYNNKFPPKRCTALEEHSFRLLSIRLSADEHSMRVESGFYSPVSYQVASYSNENR